MFAQTSSCLAALLVVFVICSESDASNVPAVAKMMEPQSVVLDKLSKADDNTIGLLSIPAGGRISRCTSGASYLHLPNAAASMNAIFKDPTKAPTSMDDYTLQYAPHDVIDTVLPTTAILFANMSDHANATNFRVYALELLDVVTSHGGDAKTDSPHVLYRMDVISVTETIGTESTEEISIEKLLENNMVDFAEGTMLMDLIDVDDDMIDAVKRNNSLATMVRTGQLVHNSERFARQLAYESGNQNALVRAQGVLTLWLLGPLSIPLYPAFIACCAVTIWIWYLIQPFLFCCII